MGTDTSPAVRHGVLILVVSLMAGAGGAWVGGQAYGSIGAGLGFVAVLVTTRQLLLMVFLDRFLSRLLGSSVRLRPSRTEVSGSARGHVDDLCGQGFVVGETVVIVDDSDLALGGPYAMLSHAHKPLAAWVGPVDITIGSELSDGRLLLTTNQPHVPTDRLIAQVFRGERAEGLLQRHDEALSRLAPTQAGANPRRRDPQYMLIADEECERAYFGGMSRLERVRALLRLTNSAASSGASA